MRAEPSGHETRERDAIGITFRRETGGSTQKDL